ncbi:MAG: hypothetical protein R3C01_01215 [Planctomycetaceae bacterium]
MAGPTLFITGEGAEQIARELSEWAATTWGETLPAHRVARRPPDGNHKVETVDILTVLLAVPTFVVTSVDVAKRLELINRAKQLIEWTKSKFRDSNTVVSYKGIDGREIVVHEAQPDDLIEMIAEQSRIAKGTSSNGVDLFDRISRERENA